MAVKVDKGDTPYDFFDAPKGNSRKPAGPKRVPDSPAGLGKPQVAGGFNFGLPGIAVPGAKLTFPSINFGGDIARRVLPTKGRRDPASNAAAQGNIDDQGLSFADYLRMANEMGLGGTPDYSGMKQHLRDTAASGDARLSAMFSKLTGDIDADAVGIAQNYDDTGAAQTANAQSAQANVQQGYDSARAAQSQQLAALGIEEAAGTLAANGGFAAGDQGAANANIEQNRVANTQQAAANKSAALNYNTGISNASSLEGAVQRSSLQQQLAEKLAQIGMQEQQDSVSSKQNNFSVAQQLMGMDQERGAGAARGAQQDFDNQLAIARLKLDESKQGGSKQTLMQQLQGQAEGYAYAQQLAQSMGVDPGNSEAMTAFLEQLKSLRQ